jgi:hypothetical protein
MRRNAIRSERGAAMLVVLVILIAMAWFALTGFRISGQHLQIVGNSQVRQHSLAAAQRAIEQTLSSNAFAHDPKAVAAAPIESDVDGDGAPDYAATLTPVPSCYRVRPIKTAELDIAKAADRNCLMSSGPPGTHYVEQSGAPVASGDSMCAATEWNIGAQVEDPATGTRVAIQQGVGIRVEKHNADNFCK